MRNLETIVRILRLIKNNGYIDEYLLRTQGFEKGTLESIIGFLLSMGFIKEVNISQSMCEKCPFRKVCTVNLTSQRKPLKGYVITKKGLEFLEKALGSKTEKK